MNNNNAFAAAMGIMLLVMCAFVIGILVLKIFFCLTMQRTMSEVRPRNRTIPPGLVWLHLLHLGGAIPILGIVIGLAAAVWDLIMVLKIGSSVRQEFEDRGMRTGSEGFGRPVGLIWTVTQLATTPIGLALNLLGPQIGDPTIVMAISLVVLGIFLISFICWIVYWVQIASYGRRLRESGGRRRRSSIEDDYDDEYRPSRRRRDDEFEDEDEERGGFDFNRRDRKRDDEYDDEDEERPRRRSREDY